MKRMLLFLCLFNLIFAAEIFAQSIRRFNASPDDTLQLLDLGRQRNLERTRDSQARADVERLEAEKPLKLDLFDTQKKLYERKVIKKFYMDEAEAEFTLNRLQIDRAKAEIDRANNSINIIDMKKKWLLEGSKDPNEAIQLYERLTRSQCNIKSLSLNIAEIQVEYSTKKMALEEELFIANQRTKKADLYKAMADLAAAKAELVAAKVEVDNCEEIINP